MSETATAQLAAPPATPGAMKRTIIEAAIVAALGALIGVGFQATRPPPAPPVEAAAPNAPPTEAIVDLPTIVTNLGAPQDVWVRLEGSIIVETKTMPHPEALAGQIGGDLLAFMRTVTLRQIEGPAGLQNLREDLAERVVARSKGKARELVIRTLVVQ